MLTLVNCCQWSTIIAKSRLPQYGLRLSFHFLKTALQSIPRVIKNVVTQDTVFTKQTIFGQKITEARCGEVCFLLKARCSCGGEGRVWVTGAVPVGYHSSGHSSLVLGCRAALTITRAVCLPLEGKSSPCFETCTGVLPSYRGSGMRFHHFGFAFRQVSSIFKEVFLGRC